jgi:hypothetical protein
VARKYLAWPLSDLTPPTVQHVRVHFQRPCHLAHRTAPFQPLHRSQLELLLERLILAPLKKGAVTHLWGLRSDREGSIGFGVRVPEVPVRLYFHWSGERADAAVFENHVISEHEIDAG